MAGCASLAVAGTASAVTESSGSVSQSILGTKNINMYYTYNTAGSPGNSTLNFTGMVNPLENLRFSSTYGTFTVNKFAGCIVGVLNGGSLASGSATVTAIERLAPLYLPGRSVQLGGRAMRDQDQIYVCAF